MSMVEERTGDDYRPDEAFVQARGGLELFGLPLRPFSFSRKLAAQQMGCVAPAIGSGVTQMAATGVYPGALNDAIIVAWLCGLKDASELTLIEFRAGQFTPDRAIEMPQRANEAARAWAEEMGITDVAAKPFAEAYELLLRVVFQIESSDFDVDVEKSGAPERGDPKEVPARPASRKASRGSRRPAGTTRRSSGKK